jgi:hypothetical protein
MIIHQSQTPLRKNGSSHTALALAVALLLTGACAAPGGSVAGDTAPQPAIPPIDAGAPEQTETATFALG